MRGRVDDSRRKTPRNPRALDGPYPLDALEEESLASPALAALRARRPSKGRRFLRLVLAFLLVVGIGIMAYPFVQQMLYEVRAHEQMREFDAFAETMHAEENATRLRELHEAMKRYNAHLDRDGQNGFVDAWSYEQASFELVEWGLPDNVFGYVEVPAIDCHLPIYLGATEANMALGAVHLSETSVPIGSFDNVSTNSVIAAHRGYWAAAMFRDIEKIKVGDEVLVTNLWGTLTYRVCATKIILPTETDEVLIQDGRDMVTLITCHPYGQNYQRYVVHCERV